MFSTRCHCGAVTLQVRGTVTAYTECNCSLCSRYGARWGYFAPTDVTITGHAHLHPYEWGPRTKSLYHCRTCGCITHWQMHAPDAPRMGINLRLADPDLLVTATPRCFDGADTGKYIEP